MSKAEIPEVSDLLRGIFRAKSLNFLAGEEGSGKSLLSMNLGLAVATGGLNFLDWVIEKPGKVLFLNNEIYFEDFVRRFQQMVQLLPGKQSLDNFIAPEAVPPLSECFDQLNELCESEKPALLILDCLYFAHNEDENDSSRMKELMRQLQGLRDKHGMCIVVIHHFKKGGRDQRLNSELMRGAGVFGAAADSILMLRRSQTDESKRILKATKLRHSADDNKRARLLSLAPEALWFRDEGEVNEDEHIQSGPTASEIIDFSEILSGGEMKFQDILKAAEGYKYSDKTVQRQLELACKAGKVVKPRYGFYVLPEAAGHEVGQVSE
jgi:archaellum biogenesis ATPase FlaH